MISKTPCVCFLLVLKNAFSHFTSLSHYKYRMGLYKSLIQVVQISRNNPHTVLEGRSLRVTRFIFKDHNRKTSIFQKKGVVNDSGS